MMLQILNGLMESEYIVDLVKILLFFVAIKTKRL
jgi:hypothetical protein